jgi:hypothetical protein
LEQDQSAISVIKGIYSFLRSFEDIPVNMVGLESSSQDFNQSIHRTLDLENLNTFWSSTGSSTKNECEWLLYQIKESPCLISSVMITVFQAYFHSRDPIYPPEKSSIFNRVSSWTVSLCFTFI